MLLLTAGLGVEFESSRNAVAFEPKPSKWGLDCPGTSGGLSAVAPLGLSPGGWQQRTSGHGSSCSRVVLASLRGPIGPIGPRWRGGVDVEIVMRTTGKVNWCEKGRPKC